jgi:hypothetical protein
MATYALTKRDMMDAYPSLFVDEADVLDHLFFTIGNGYEWVEGQLVDVCEERDELYIERTQKKRIERAHKKLAEALNDFGEESILIQHYRDELALAKKSPAAQRAAERRHRVQSAKNPIGHKRSQVHVFDKAGQLKRYVYPLCEYSHVVSIPDDVQSDWFKAAQRALKLLGGPLIHRPGETQRNKKWLKVAQRRIDAIKEQIRAKGRTHS